MYSIKNSRNSWLIILLLLCFNANANVIKEAQDFLIEINNDQGFWFYHSSGAESSQSEEVLLKECQLQNNEHLSAIESKKALFGEINQQSQFTDNQVLLLFTELENSQREQDIRHFADQYQLPLIVVNKKQGQFQLNIEGRETPVLLQNTFVRLTASFQDVFLVNPRKQQILLLSRSAQPCLLDQALFFELYKTLTEREELK